MAVRTATLSVLFTSDGSQFERGIDRALRKAGVQLGDFSKKVAGAAAGAATALGTLVAGASRAADGLAKTADKLGATTEGLAGLRYAAQFAGVETATLDMGLQRMVRRIAEAAQGTGEAKDALKELGLSAEALNKLRPEEQFRLIADAMASIPEQGDRVRLAMRLFDSEGVGLVNLLHEGGDALRAMEEEAARAGVAFSRVDAARFEEANDAVARLRGQVEGLRNRIALELLPALEAAGTELGELTAAERFEGFARWFQSLVATVVAGWEAMNAKLYDFQADAAEALAGFLRSNGEMVDGAIRAVEAAVQAAVDGIESVLNAAAAGANSVLRGLNRIPGVDLGEAAVARVDFGPVDLGDAGGLTEKADALARENREAADAARAAAAAAEETAGELAAEMNAVLEGTRRAEEASAAGTEKVQETLTRLEDTGRAVGTATGKARKAVEKLTDAEREAARVRESVRTPAEVYAEEKRKLDRLLAAGHLTAEEHARAMNLAGEKARRAATEAAGAWGEAGRSVTGAIEDWARTGELSFDRLREAAVRAAIEVAAQWIASMAQAQGAIAGVPGQLQGAVPGAGAEGGGLGGLVGGVLGGIGIGGSAAGGARGSTSQVPSTAVGGGIGGGATDGGGGGFWSSALGIVGSALPFFFAEGGRPPVGKASVVGERGPELFVPDRAGTIVPNGAWSSAMAGTAGSAATGAKRTEQPPVTVNHYFSSGLDRAEVAGLLAASERRTLAAVAQQIGAGGSYRRAVRV